MAVVVSETFTGNNGDPWPSQMTLEWFYNNGPALTSLINNNTGVITASASSQGVIRYSFRKMASISDIDVTFSITGTNTSGLWDQYNYFTINSSVYPTNAESVSWGYTLLVHGASATSIDLQLIAKRGGSNTTLYPLTNNTTLNIANKLNVRFNRTGNTVSFKAWQASGSEPASWTFSTTDAVTPVIPPGVFTFSSNFSHGTIVYDDIVIDDLSVPSVSTQVPWISV